MLRSSTDHAIKTIKYLNASNAILSKTNAQLVATVHARKQTKKGKQVIGKAHLLSKDDADRLRADIEAKETADIAHKAAMEEKKKEQARKKAQEEAEKLEKAIRRAVIKDARDTNTELARMAKIDKRLFI
jgi:AAA15 family ATPase/GTPase